MQDQNPLKSVALSFICNEDWDKMHPTETGRHCDVCNKTVVDFTDRTQDDFTKALAEANGKLCGRFKAKQTIHLPEFRFDKAAAILMATAGLSFLSAESKAQTKLLGKPAAPRTEETLKGNAIAPVTPTVRGEVAPPATQDTVKKRLAICTGPPKKDWKEQVFLGDTIIMTPPEPVDTIGVDTTAKSIPHSIPVTLRAEVVYPGGDEALQKAISYNLRWPVKLAEPVTVYVQMRINAEGLVTDAYMIKGHRPDVDAEAMRIARLLVFTPAKGSDGEPINSVLTIPINFTKKE